MEAEHVLDDSFGYQQMLCSMCWDHNNDVLLWNWTDAASLVWIDVDDSYTVNMGDPSESGVCMFVGLFTVPEEIPALPEVAVESITAKDMVLFSGSEKTPAVTIAPVNATCQNVSLTSSDPTVVEITEDGKLYGVSAGTAVITATLHDNIGGKDYELSFNVTVRLNADNMYSHLLTDISSYNGQFWINLDPSDPQNYTFSSDYFYYTVFAGEYVDGKIYTYGCDPIDFEANWQFFVLDAETYEIETQIDMGDAFPFVYDMSYDYITSTMYLLAGAGEEDTQLYMANLETGEITLVLDPNPLLMALAAGPDGKLYAIEQSTMTMDPETYETIFTNANLYVIDPLEGTVEYVGDTGITVCLR